MHRWEYLAKHSGVKKRGRIIFSEFSGESYVETTPYDIYMNHSKKYNKVFSVHKLRTSDNGIIFASTVKHNHKKVLHLAVFLFFLLFILPFWLWGFRCSTILGLIVSLLSREPPLAISKGSSAHKTNSLFSLTWECLDFPPLLKDVFTGYMILGWQLFYLSTWNMFSHFPPASIIPDEKFTVVPIAFLLWVKCCFSLVAFQIFCLCGFQKSDKDESLCGFP